jgi:hypothetical protein
LTGYAVIFFTEGCLTMLFLFHLLKIFWLLFRENL